MIDVLSWTYSICIFAARSGVIPAAVVVASLNLLVQILFSAAFGAKGLPKIRGYRADD